MYGKKISTHEWTCTSKPLVKAQLLNYSLVWGLAWTDWKDFVMDIK